MPSGGIFDYDIKKERLEEVERNLEEPDVWNNPERAQQLGRERAELDHLLCDLDAIHAGLAEAVQLVALAKDEDDAEVFEVVLHDIGSLEQKLAHQEFLCMFDGQFDSHNCYLDIQAGSGGTESQDWAEMLLRMYLRFCEQQGFAAELLEVSAGDVAGIKSATIKIDGSYAYGWLRTETGVHRLVRKSPFDSGNRRHTSFAAVFVAAQIDENIEIEINPADLRVDVYRASGAGGQHVNRTESAVRITHAPSGIVVQCQSDRSQHRNRETAMNQLKAKLYERELKQKQQAAQNIEDNKADIGWGSQIRSYVLDSGRIKDLRTNVETGNTQAVLDGDLQPFISASLKAGF